MTFILLNADKMCIRDRFRSEPKIYSKIDDLPPAKYNTGSVVKNSLVSSGCILNSKVENSVLFKNVFVGKNCVIKNSIILNDVYIGDNTHIENCIVESRGTLNANTYYCLLYTSFPTKPLFIKGFGIVDNVDNFVQNRYG